jgi:hypothetical protein
VAQLGRSVWGGPRGEVVVDSVTMGDGVTVIKVYMGQEKGRSAPRAGVGRADCRRAGVFLAADIGHLGDCRR